MFPENPPFQPIRIYGFALNRSDCLSAKSEQFHFLHWYRWCGEEASFSSRHWTGYSPGLRLSFQTQHLSSFTAQTVSRKNRMRQVSNTRNIFFAEAWNRGDGSHSQVSNRYVLFWTMFISTISSWWCGLFSALSETSLKTMKLEENLHQGNWTKIKRHKSCESVAFVNKDFFSNHNDCFLVGKTDFRPSGWKPGPPCCHVRVVVVLGVLA